MKLYLMQHGLAVSPEANPDRPLSPQGVEDVTRVAAFLRDLHPDLPAIWHSPKTRARQTADLVARILAPSPRLIEKPGLEPEAAVPPLRQTLVHAGADVLLVSHLPLVSGLVSELVIGQAALPIIHFTPGTLVCLAQDEHRQWRVSWMLTPEILTLAHD